MRKLTLIALFVCSALYAQEYTEILVFDISGVTTDTTRSISVKKLGRDIGRLFEVDFTSTNCDLLSLNIGYSVSNEYPLFLDTIPNIQMPILLDKTVYSTTYKGVENNSVGLNIMPYDGNYLWINIIYNGGCTAGEIKLRYAK